jgi:hypothetical protein
MKKYFTISPRLTKWLKRLGFWGFLFFLVKGLLWLVFFYWLGKKL